MRGWRYESQRHALAAKGIQSYRAVRESIFFDEVEARKKKVLPRWRIDQISLRAKDTSDMEKEILDDVEREEHFDEYIAGLSPSARKKLLSQLRGEK